MTHCIVRERARVEIPSRIEMFFRDGPPELPRLPRGTVPGEKNRPGERVGSLGDVWHPKLLRSVSGRQKIDSGWAQGDLIQSSFLSSGFHGSGAGSLLLSYLTFV